MNAEKLASNLAGAEVPKPRNGPLWAGPEDPSNMGGITFSMLSRFLGCRERFRIRYIEGLKPADKFNHKIEYGQMWHACEEEFARTKGSDDNWQRALLEYAKDLVSKYRYQQEEIEKWYNVCKVQFPLYVAYWKQHPDTLKRRPLFQEQTFKTAYTLSSGRIVYLRGKRDSGDIIDNKLWLQENKTKGDIKEEQLQRQLTFDLQTMMYIIALQIDYKKYPIGGVRYNVVRRPLSGGEGTIVRHKATEGSKCQAAGCFAKTGTPGSWCTKCHGTGRIGGKPEETKESFYKRVSEYIEAKPETYFMRWNIPITREDIAKFAGTCLNPILEQLCTWYAHVSSCYRIGAAPFESCHWRHPFGLYNVLDEGGASEFDEKLATDNEVGLVRADTLFEELNPTP